MNPKKLVLRPLIIAALFLSSCSHDSLDKAKEEGPPPSEEKVQFTPPVVTDEEAGAGLANAVTSESDKKVMVMDATANPAPEKIPEKIKKTADINITVDDYREARAAIEKIVKSGAAYIAGENEQNSTYSISNTMIIRVVNRSFDGMVSSIGSIKGHVNSKNIYTENVTAEFVDITARLKSKKEVEKRYLDLLQKAAKVSDILEVEEQLRVIREEIEAKEGELKYLNDQVDYSTINLSIHQDFEYTPEDRPGFFGRMGTAFGNGWSGFLGFIVGLVYAWPLLLILSLLGYFFYKFIRRQVKK
jgi:hypothetical protein